VYGNINIRFFGYPVLAMNNYSDFFAHHQLTHFCQIAIIRAHYAEVAWLFEAKRLITFAQPRFAWGSVPM
jgi:hypothetical protein